MCVVTWTLNFWGFQITFLRLSEALPAPSDELADLSLSLLPKHPWMEYAARTPCYDNRPDIKKQSLIKRDQEEVANRRKHSKEKAEPEANKRSGSKERNAHAEALQRVIEAMQPVEHIRFYMVYLHPPPTGPISYNHIFLPTQKTVQGWR